MARAGFCSVCASNVWIDEHGRCANGHPGEYVSGFYEVAAQPPPPQAVAAAPAPHAAPSVAAYAPYAGPAGGAVLIGNVGYVSSKRMRSGWYIGFDDVGTLTVEGDRASFIGRKGRLDLYYLDTPRIWRPRWNPTTKLILSALVFAGLALLGLVLATYSLLILFPVYALALLGRVGLRALFVRSRRWIVLTGTSANGERLDSHFTIAGWTGRRGAAFEPLHPVKDVRGR